MHTYIHTYTHHLSSKKDVILYFTSFQNVLKSMAFMSAGVQNDLDSKHFLRQSASLLGVYRF